MTTQTSWRVGLWTLLLAVTALGGVASAQSGQGYGSRITVYADINFAGQSASFDGDTPNLVSAGWNDNISSIRVPNGETWEICVDENYGNQCQAVTGSVADLRSMGWNDKISSIRRTTNNGGGRGRGWARGNDSNLRSAGVAVYANPNYSGQSAVLHSDTPNLVTLNMNDKVSSIRIPNGETWEVCQDINYESQCQVLSASVPDLRRMGWNGRISSLRQVNDDRGLGDRRTGTGGVFQNSAQHALLFFDRAGFRGRSTRVSIGNSRIGVRAWQGSVQIRGGGAWELCDTSGNCATIDEDLSELSDLGLNDRIISARVVNNSQYRR